MAQNDKPKRAWNSIDNPLSQQTHVDCAHRLLINTVELDHVKKVEHNSHTHPRKIGGREHDGGAIGAALVHAIHIR